MAKSTFPIECINEIFKHFENDTTSLHSCLLVNRLWCRTIIPILWRKPFSLMQRSIKFSLSLIEIYLLFLNEEEKQLRKYHPELYPIFKKVLFNYPSFLKEFYYETMFSSIKLWVKTTITITSSQFDNQYNSNYINKISHRLSQSLFKMFLRNNAKVYLLNIKSFENNPDFPYLPKDSFSTSFSNLKIFQFSVDSQPLYNLPNTYSFLKSLSQSCNTLSHIFIDSYFNNNDDGKEEIFFNIIKSQRNIKKFIINSHGNIPKSILNLLINQSSLVLLHFIDTKFNNLFPFEILLNCNNLKFLLIVNCHELEHNNNTINNNNSNNSNNTSLSSHTIPSSHTITSLSSSSSSSSSLSPKNIKCKIDTLHLKNNHFLPLTISNLIQLSGINLTTLCLDRTTSYIILSKPLSIHCPNITHLILTLDSISFFQSVQSIISNLNLKYFGIRSFGWTNELISDLGNYLPISLKYLELSCFFDYEALYMLLKNCKCKLRGLIMIMFNDDYLKFIIDYAKINDEFNLLGIDGYLAEDDESSFLKILKEETNVKIVDQDEIKFESSPLYFDYLYKR
ncbi:hypothetical protein RhiirA5_409420 [Rhizophagus irregularis]|uniref:F-box domain-containing protein n=2 Tax=Rhizophagus irregularis TaxID=588596 RepID=A0A2N0Q5S8_9GLOM|nr:hypothetical protein RhiirA5_409420 [Rhizophagus irregularis]PKC75058.1 hypothetical protein RhiirA1_449280 [Rhizophagus irregularis]